jgi:peroxiredoxin
MAFADSSVRMQSASSTRFMWRTVIGTTLDRMRGTRTGSAIMPMPCALFGAALFSLFLTGCSSDDPYQNDSIGGGMIRFKDDAVANAAPGEAILNLSFIDQSGKTFRPRDFTAKQNLVLVFVRGYNGSICPYCSTYLSGLIANFKEIAARDAAVLVVYPIAKPNQSQRLDEFLQATFQNSSPAVNQTPFPVVLDVGLTAVDALGIRKDLAKPATYILDKKGQVRFAYVGNSLSDRPSIKAILKQLDAIAREPS